LINHHDVGLSSASSSPLHEIIDRQCNLRPSIMVKSLVN
jgi:hypothetical protein